MKQKRHTTDEIIRVLREADQGKSTEAICREHNITTTSYYRWKKKYGGEDLIEVMERLVAERGAPAHMRSDNGSEFIARILQKWLAQRQVKTLYIEPGSPWQNGHVESFNGSLRDECLDRELMLSVAEARVLIEDYRRHYNEERPHGGIGYRTPAQARMEALGSSRPEGSLRQELESNNTPVTLKT